MPWPGLAAAAAHFEVPLEDAAIDALVAGPLFTTYSKNPTVVFGNADRLARRAALECEIAGELGTAEAWVAKMTDGAGAPELPADLL